MATKQKKNRSKQNYGKISAGMKKIICSVPKFDPFVDAEGCRFDEKKALYYINFIEDCCSHVEGDLAFQPFILERWQKAIVANLFGWLKKDSYGRTVRRFREAFIYVPRKNGKTPMVAAIVNAAFFLDDEYAQRNFCAAADTEQANELYRHIAGMIKNEPNMNARCREYTSFKTIIKQEDESSTKVISAEANTKHGKNPHIIAVDELHAQPNRELMDVLQTSFASINRKQPLFIKITTADYKRESPCNESYEYAKKVRDGIIKDQSLLPVIYEASAEDDWTKVSVWRKVNPNLGVSVSIDYLKHECKRAQEIPAYENTFKRLHLNIQTEQDVRWLPIDLWDKCEETKDEDILIGRECFAGFDLSSRVNTTSYVLLFPPNKTDPKYRIIMRCFLPMDNIEKREVKERMQYQLYEQRGELILTEGNVVDYARIKEKFESDYRKFNILEVAFDRWNFEGLRQLFLLEGCPQEKFVSFGQGFVSMSEPSKELEKLILAREIAHDGNQLLRRMVGTVMVEMDAAGNYKPSKKKSGEQIDGVVALIMSLGRAMVAPSKESIYEKRGIRTLGGNETN